MKANEFVRKHGLAEVKILLTSPSHGFFFKEDFYKHYGFDIYEDLKRLVESHELVSNFGGLKRAKRILKKAYTSFNTLISVVWNDKPFQCTIQKLEQAIADVESCQ